MIQEIGCARSDFGSSEITDNLSAECLQNPGRLLCGGGLIARNRDVVVVSAPHVDAQGLGGSLNRCGLSRHARKHRVEEIVVRHVDTGGGQPGGHATGMTVHPAGDCCQPVGAVIAGVHRGHHRQQDLGGADVRRRLVPANVLFAGL